MVQVVGRDVKLVLALVSLWHGPLLRSRKNSVPLPVPSTAIQYFVPDVTLSVGTVMLFHAPAAIVVILPWLRSVPGWPLLSPYRPTAILVTVEDLST